MCGIVGVIKQNASINIRIRDVFTMLLYVDAIRGKDGTGIMTIKDGSVDWRKSGTPVWDFFSLRGVPEFIRNVDENHFIVGHNRATSKGASNHANAHPFHIRHICGVHNGTLHSTYELKPEKGMDVDSEMAYNAIARDGITDVSKKLQGSYSLVWWDNKIKKLNFLRNSERPMNLVWIKEPQIILFGSELGMLQWAAHRAKFEIERHMETVPHVLYKFKEGSLKPSLQKVEEYKSLYSGGYRGGVQNWPHQRSFNDDETNDFYEGCARPTARSPLLALPAPATKAEKEEKSTNVVSFPFPKAQKTALQEGIENIVHSDTTIHQQERSQILGENYRRWLRGLSANFKPGTSMNFSIHDYGNRCHGNFYPVEGKHQRFPDDIIVKGNYFGDETELIATRNLMEGIITQVAVLKKENKLLIQMRDLRISTIPDPELRNSKGVELKKDEPYMGKFICCECGKPKGPGIKPIIIVEDNVEQYVCPECANGGQTETTTEIKECCGMVDTAFCVYHEAGECPDDNQHITLQ